MAIVTIHAAVSLDGFIARPDDMPGPIFDFYSAGDVEVTPGDDERTFRVDEATAAEMAQWDPKGVSVVGRHLFDFVDGWQGRPPSGEHVFGVTHRDADEWQERYPDAPFTFVGNLEDAVRMACAHVGPQGSVTISAGDLGGQAVAAGLVDEVVLDVAPVFLGRGKPFMGAFAEEVILEDPHRVVQGARVLHLHFRIRRAQAADG